MFGVIALALVEGLNKPKQRQNRFFIGLLILLLVHVIGELYIYTGAYRYAPSIAGVNFPVRMLLGPALYFYACSVMSTASISKRTYLTALSGPLVVILAMLPFFFLISPDQKLALADPATRDPVLWRIALTTCLFATTVFLLFTGYFLMASLNLHRRHREYVMARFSSIEQRSLDWFRMLLWLWGAVWLMYAAEFTLGAVQIFWFGSGVMLPIFEVTILVVFLHKALNQPILEEDEKKSVSSNEQRQPMLSEERMLAVAGKLNEAMTKERVYLQEDLSLGRLSDAIAVSENHISETLSQHLQTNFFQYVNGFRIADAKTRLENNDQLVSTIAFDVGFKSKSTFNAAFKANVGCTPSLYRKQTNPPNSNPQGNMSPLTPREPS